MPTSSRAMRGRQKRPTGGASLNAVAMWTWEMEINNPHCLNDKTTGSKFRFRYPFILELKRWKYIHVYFEDGDADAIEATDGGASLSVVAMWTWIMALKDTKC